MRLTKIASADHPPQAGRPTDFQRRMLRFPVMAALALLPMFAQPVQAQTEPSTLPLLSVADVTYAGSFTLPAQAGPTQDLDAILYGGWALGMGPDGTSIYYGCHDRGDRLARVTIPAIGARASVVENCREVTPGHFGISGSGNGMVLGGTVAINGKFFTGATTYYTDIPQSASLWIGESLAAMRGPLKVGTGNQRTFGGYMGVVPPEFRALLGGDVLAGKCCSSILNNSSFGPSVSVFESATVEATKAATRLVDYPSDHQTVGSYYDPGGTSGFGMGSRLGGVAMIGGTNSTWFLGVQGEGACYGTGTANQALHRKPRASNPADVWCYNPLWVNAHGNHGYPYFWALWEYRTSDLLDVKRGKKQPWDVKPVRISKLPGSMPMHGDVLGATFDPATRTLYATGDTGGGTPRVHVWRVAGSPAPPPPPPPPPPAPTATLDAAPTTIEIGGSSTLTWTSTNGTAVFDQGIGQVAASGSRVVTPTQTTAYTLTVTSATGATAQQTVLITVNPLPPPPPPPPPVPVPLDLTCTTKAGVTTCTGTAPDGTTFTVRTPPGQ